MKPSLTRRPMSAFSLMEVLIVIVVIGVITGIAIPMMMNVREEARENSHRRTAQIVASTAASASSAGDLAIAGAANKTDAIELLSQGVEGEGVFAGVRYRVELGEEEKVAVAEYLQFANGLLLFAPGN